MPAPCPSAADIALVRSHVGQQVTPAAIITAIGQTGSPLAAAALLLRGRVTEMLTGEAAKTDVDGEYSEDWSANLKQLQAAADRLDLQVAQQQAPTVAGGLGQRRLTRPGVR